MRIAVIFLVVLGLLAAVCAAILVNTLTHKPVVVQKQEKVDDRVDLLLAERDIPAMSVVDAGMVKTQKVLKSQVPEGALTNSVQVVGKVLTQSMVAGEPFSKSCFARKSEGVYLAAALPQGKRAVSVSLAEWSCMAGLLYPGSVVDVLVTFKPEVTEGKAEPVSTTILQGLQVLAVGSQSVATEDYSDKEAGALSSKGKMNYRMVTLLVEPKQAEILQLAVTGGSIALAMRNPLDTSRDARRVTHTTELGLPGSAAPVVPVALMPPPAPPPQPKIEKVEKTEPQDKPQAPKVWTLMIVRGQKTEQREFPMPESEPQEPVPAGQRVPDGSRSF